MRNILASNWWSVVTRGVIAILFGIFTFAMPGIALAAWVLLFGAYALFDGVMSITGAIKAGHANERWRSLVLAGIAGIAAATVTVLWPAITALTLVYVIAAWAVVMGVFEIVAAVRLRKHIEGEWLLALGGIASLLFGMLLIFSPLAGALAITLWFGAYAIVSGVVLIALGLRLRTWGKDISAGPPFAIPAH
jgi:uncharacterized membrane protein HdeD (DUF308 family)